MKALRWADVASFLVILGVDIAIRPRTVVWFIGICLAAVAFPLWMLARFQLGSAFSIKPQAHHLVTTGLYSKLRHPIYIFGCLAELGVLLALQSWIVLAIWLPTLPIELVRARREAEVLHAAFGEEYERYRTRTWF